MKIGVALSGGGARGIAHLGVVKALQELGYEIEAYSGTSAGAIASVFLAAGLTPDEVLKKLLSLNIYSLLRLNLSTPGILGNAALHRLIETHLPVKTFEELQTPVTVCAADIVQVKRIYFQKGELLRPLLATTAIPVMFQAVEYQGWTLVDGGLLNNLPIEPLIGSNCQIVAVHCNKVSINVKLRTTRSFFERSMQILLQENVRDSVTFCDFLIEPEELGQYSITQFSKAAEIFENGYAYTHKIAHKLLRKLPLETAPGLT